MSWKKYFRVANTSGQNSPLGGPSRRFGSNDFAFRNYASTLPEVYIGHPNRVERYNQYEAMDLDSEVSACLDIIAEFSTQRNESNNTPFSFHFKEQPTDNEVAILTKQLSQWCNLNQFQKRMFKLFRNTIKYGDQIFVRDPETFQLMWVDMTKVPRVIVNENKGKEPEQYVVKDINPNFQNLTVAAKTMNDFQTTPIGTPAQISYSAPNAVSNASIGRFGKNQNESVIDAKHIVHISLNEGLDHLWPFGQSILENVYKVFKQKELLEDAILIYRIQRAPERLVFYVDTGDMPTHMAMSFVEKIKNEMHQRRIPTLNGGGNSPLDASYNPLSMNENFFFPQTAEGRGSKVEQLPGGNSIGEITDLKFFANKLARGLRVPSSYLPSGPDDDVSPLNDGRVGTALIQEYRFNQYCERLQALVAEKLDQEFKMFLNWRGFNIDSALFEIVLQPPQNFASYRQSELDSVRITNFQSMETLSYISKRFAMERFLGLTKDEIIENEKMWREEHDEPVAGESAPYGSDLRTVGVSPGDIGSDMDMAAEFDEIEDFGDEIPTGGPSLETPLTEPSPETPSV
jgi:hypothetical protein